MRFLYQSCSYAVLLFVSFNCMPLLAVPRVLAPHELKTTFKDVAGAHEAKEELHTVVEFLKNPKKYSRFGAKVPRGILLVGEPGNGKTLLARAVAGEANCSFIVVSGAEFVEMFVGLGAARVRELFESARNHTPCIIFIDELDAIGAKRGSSGGGGDLEYANVLNQFLTELDGFVEDKKPLIVIGATNRPDILDPALTRPGRLGKHIVVPYPDVHSREAILKVHTRGKKLEVNINLSDLARGTPGFSGAQLADLCNEAALLAAKRTNATAIALQDFEEARDVMLLGKVWKTRHVSDQEKKITAFHEAGHALVGLLLPEHAEPLYKVTIDPRGETLGTTHFMNDGDVNTRSLNQLLAQIKHLMGGRVAEQLVFGDLNLTTGASSDLQRATRLARSLIMQAMTDDLGLMFIEGPVSEQTAREIDTAVRALLTKCHQETVTLLQQHRDKLNTLANALLKKGTLFAHEVYTLLGIPPRKDLRFVKG